MASLKKAIKLRYIYLTFKNKIISIYVYIYISVLAPLSSARTDIFQFIHKRVFDHNTCTAN